MTPALFIPEGERFIPTELSRGPWTDDAQHGGPPAALLARAVERVDGGRGSIRPSEERFAVDLAQSPVIGLDDGVGPDHLQIEYCPAGADCVDHFA